MVTNSRNGRGLARIDDQTGEVMGYDNVAESYDPRIVTEDYKRELKQFQGFGAGINDSMSPAEIFKSIKSDIQKLVNYDGCPTVVLGDYAGRTIVIVGAVFTSRHTFKSKEVIDSRTGEGAIMAGYDKLILKVPYMLGSSGKWIPTGNEEQPFLMMQTSANQPCLIFEEAMKAGLAPGDFPEHDGIQGNMTFKVYKSGNTISLGLAEVDFDPANIKGARND